MTITLPDDLERVVQRHVASGRFPAPADVIAAALELLDADANPDDHAKLRAMIAEGDAAIAQGKVGPFDAMQTLARIRAARGAV